jgi:glycosyltransferase involved in cell wall biosynthesis
MVPNFKKDNKTMIAVLICTKNGCLYLNDQLNSIKDQTFKNIDIFISDHGSTDDTIKTIEKFILDNPDVKISFKKGEDDHFAVNYINLAKSLKKEYSYYAFCDQDDIWEDFHLSRSINDAKNIRGDIPLLFCSATLLIDKKGNKIGVSKKFKKKLSFENALVQSIAGANTMIFNHETFKLLKSINISHINPPSHDWLLYLLVTSHNGIIKYRLNPSVKYRQHSSNAIGSNIGIKAFIKRAIFVWKGEWRQWLDSNMIILKNCPDISNEASCKIHDFTVARNTKNPFLRFVKFLKLGMYRQTFIGNISLLISIILRKI